MNVNETVKESNSPAPPSRAKKQWNIVINNRFCKGCSICVDFCPTGVLGMEGSLAVIKAKEKCTGCQLCDLRCPDFAIQVFEV